MCTRIIGGEGRKEKEGERGTKGREANLLKSYFLTMCYKTRCVVRQGAIHHFENIHVVLIVSVSQSWSMVGMNLNNSSVPPFKNS